MSTSKYAGFFGNILAASDKNNKTYDTIYPLNTPNIDTKLRFTPWNPCTDDQQIVAAVTDQELPPLQNSCVQRPKGEEPQFFFRGAPRPPNSLVDTQTMLTIYGDKIPPPQNPNNFFAPYSTDNIRLQPYDVGGGASFLEGQWNLTQGKHPLNMQFDGSYYKVGNSTPTSIGNVVMCNGDQFKKVNIFNANTADYNSPSCKWRTDQEAFSCCTARRGQWTGKDPDNPTQPYLNSYCAPSFMPDGAPGSICPQFMLNICENNWDDNICISYLQSFVDNADVANVVQKTVKNYINGQASRTGCGYNQYTTPNTPWKCTDPSTGKYRDDSTDNFLSKTLETLCTANNSGTQPGFCDLILNQYCSQFTREDLLSYDDNGTLQKICGCHLSGVSGNQQLGGGLTNLGPNRKTQPNQYPFPGINAACDPICNFSKTIPYGTETCDSTVCILDKININEINSQTGKITINQVCKGGGKGKRGNCYISGLDINSINSQTGGVKLKQGCDACYAFCPGDAWNQDAPAGAVKVDCSNPATSYNPNMCKGGSYKPPPGNGGGNGNGNGGNGNGGSTGARGGILNRFTAWTKDHPYITLGAGLTLLLLFVILVTLLYVHFS